ncbi:UPF0481 protein At3g47200 [Aegilops tauschii subsp. strangulata]|uniref:Uncharacterized protein n=2 Tax=Aegilops tauschii subsp. strangulata TaxID=200361 RepID=A0A453DLY9_AEGTS|nr:UPF0481 protein At3g47200 [Aegilops tauschii subsp. strangulata]
MDEKESRLCQFFPYIYTTIQKHKACVGRQATSLGCRMSSSWVVDVDYLEPQANVKGWVVDMEKKLEDAEPPAKVQRWPKHCIFRVPLRFTSKMVDGMASSVFKPQTVSLGPFHHDDKDLKPMEEHKLRAVRHLLRRDSKLTLGGLVAAMETVADEPEDAYMNLGDEWRGEENRGKFLEMMITDGCFLLEVMRMAIGGKGSIPKDYEHGDPVFSWHGIQHIGPFVQRDMLLVENQLPLRLLEKIVAVEEGTSPSAASINSMVLKFLEREDAPEGTGLGLHPLDIYRTSRLKGTSQVKNNGKGLQRGVNMTSAPMEVGIFRSQKVVPRSAWKLSEAGIRFLPSKTGCLDDIQLDNGRLYMPKVHMDDSTAYRIHNMMAFEAMHIRTGNDVTAYVLFVKDLISSADDVRLLGRKGILEHDLADDDDAVVRLFNSLTRDVSKNWESHLCRVRDAVEHHYTSNHLRVILYESWSHLKSKYFRNPWSLLALATAILLVVGDIVQAVYAVISYDPNEGKPKIH